MQRPVKLAVRFLAILVLILLCSVVLGPTSPKTSPYSSALSNLTMGNVLAATHCEDRACATDPVTLKFICVKSTGTSCSAFNSNGPVASKCIENPC